MTKTLIIRQLSRFPKQGRSDQLDFQDGVNVIVGRPNAGKTQWLKMQDYLMGDDDTVESAFAASLVKKYDSIHAVFEVEGEELHVERRWKEPGTKTKIFVNDEAIPATEFSSYLMSKLDMPQLKYRSGERGWVALSWRMLLRHIYRRDTSWSEIASKQPESEQLACLLHFTGLGDFLFRLNVNSLMKSVRTSLNNRLSETRIWMYLITFRVTLLKEQSKLLE